MPSLGQEVHQMIPAHLAVSERRKASKMNGVVSKVEIIVIRKEKTILVCSID